MNTEATWPIRVGGVYEDPDEEGIQAKVLFVDHVEEIVTFMHLFPLTQRETGPYRASFCAFRACWLPEGVCTK
jgi:hypothetical protein